MKSYIKPNTQPYLAYIDGIRTSLFKIEHDLPESAFDHDVDLEAVLLQEGVDMHQLINVLTDALCVVKKLKITDPNFQSHLYCTMFNVVGQYAKTKKVLTDKDHIQGIGLVLDKYSEELHKPALDTDAVL